MFLVHCPGEKFRLLLLHLLFKGNELRVRIHVADSRETPAMEELDDVANLIGIKNSKFRRHTKATITRLIEMLFP